MRTAIGIFAFVTAAALAGMVLGGLFGLAAGALAPALFTTFMPWAELEPVGTAVVIGGAGGVLCGGALGGFAIVLGVVLELIRAWRVRGAA